MGLIGLHHGHRVSRAPIFQCLGNHWQQFCEKEYFQNFWVFHFPSVNKWCYTTHGCMTACWMQLQIWFAQVAQFSKYSPKTVSDHRVLWRGRSRGGVVAGDKTLICGSNIGIWPLSFEAWVGTAGVGVVSHDKTLLDATCPLSFTMPRSVSVTRGCITENQWKRRRRRKNLKTGRKETRATPLCPLR